MRRDNTIVFGSQMGPASPPEQRNHARTGTLIQEERRVNDRVPPNQAPPPARTPSSMNVRQRFGSDPGPVSAPAPVSSRAESQWFAATNPRLAPVGHEIFEERRGWQPPPASRGLMFTAVSVLLVGVAAAGTFFLLGPNEPRSHATTPVSTTTLTNAEVPATTASEPLAAPPPDPAAPMMMRTVTPNDLPSAPPVVDAVKEPAPAGWHPTKPPAATPKPNAAAAAPAARNAKAVAPAKAAKAPAASKKSEGSLPDLDRAATAAGMTPLQDDPFATPGTDTPPAPAATSATSTTSTVPSTSTAGGVAEPSTGSTGASAPSTSAPSGSEVMPDLQIKR